MKKSVAAPPPSAVAYIGPAGCRMQTGAGAGRSGRGARRPCARAFRHGICADGKPTPCAAVCAADIERAGLARPGAGRIAALCPDTKPSRARAFPRALRAAAPGRIRLHRPRERGQRAPSRPWLSIPWACFRAHKRGSPPCSETLGLLRICCFFCFGRIHSGAGVFRRGDRTRLGAASNGIVRRPDRRGISIAGILPAVRDEFSAKAYAVGLFRYMENAPDLTDTVLWAPYFYSLVQPFTANAYAALYTDADE